MKEKLLMLGVCLFLATCSEPEGPEPLPPIKEKFVWRLDTIRSPGAWQFFLHDVFGTSDGSVYVAAMGNGGWREVPVFEDLSYPWSGLKRFLSIPTILI